MSHQNTAQSTGFLHFSSISSRGKETMKRFSDTINQKKETHSARVKRRKQNSLEKFANWMDLHLPTRFILIANFSLTPRRLTVSSSVFATLPQSSLRSERRTDRPTDQQTNKRVSKTCRMVSIQLSPCQKKKTHIKCFRQSHSGMPKRHQEPVLVFRELKPKFAECSPAVTPIIHVRMQGLNGLFSLCELSHFACLHTRFHQVRSLVGLASAVATWICFTLLLWHMPKTWIVHLLFCCDAGTTGVIAGTTGNQSATKFEFVLAET